MPPPVPPLSIGPLRVWPPVVLAPMAGVTNPAFRRLCRDFAATGSGSEVPATPAGSGVQATQAGSGVQATQAGTRCLFVSEMITARGLVEGAARTFERAAFDPDESPRSIQLYGSDPAVMGDAVRRLVGEGRVDHIDINMGCPVRKITRHGGGAALTARPRLVAAIVRAATDAAAELAGPGRPAVPVTVKFRTGLDDHTVTYLDTGRAAEAEGAAAVALHGRTAAQLYSGTADWDAIARLKEAVTTIPVLGNGDVWTTRDARALLARTGCDGVVVGRGCLGRPWLFRDLVDAFEGREPAGPPGLGAVAGTLATHLRLLTERMGAARALLDIRKHIGWYLTGYPVGGDTRRALAGAGSVDELLERLALLPPDVTVADGTAELPRGTQRGPQRVVLPVGWLEGSASARAPADAAGAFVSGG